MECNTLDPDVRGCYDGKEEEEKNEGKRLPVVGCDPLDAKEDRSQKLPLTSFEACPHHICDATVIRS